MQAIIEFSGSIGGFLWGQWAFFILMAAGILFTLWTKFTQYTAMTHGVAVVRGVYDNPDDPGAINHFQALSAALSATVGLGNIGGVALAIAAGGPGALFWMWIIGFLGMALKTVEINLAMMYRNTDDPDNPHGGAMWVVDRVVGAKGGIWKTLAKIIGVTFCITLIISTFTGGNMFQSWSVADLTDTFWGVDRLATGILLAVIVGLVIVGGIKRIGSVAGRLVPFMCAIYLIAGLSVIAVHIADLPAMFALVVKSAFGPTEAGGAFLGGTLGWAFSTGLRRALFSNEAGQGSAPIAHAAAKTNEPAREGIVGGLGPFIDTICICTLTAMVILLTGTWNRAPMAEFTGNPTVAPVYTLAPTPLTDAADLAAGTPVFMRVAPPGGPTGAPAASDLIKGVVEVDESGTRVAWEDYTGFNAPQGGTMNVFFRNESGAETPAGTIAAMPVGTRAVDDGGTPNLASDDKPYWGLLTESQRVEITDDNDHLWENIDDVFTVLNGDDVVNTGASLHELTGHARIREGLLIMEWGSMASTAEPTLVERAGLYRSYSGASLTAHAFDRQFPGLGKILITIAAWLFAISTMISWSYYGEQGIIYMVGERFVLLYKLVFLAGTVFAAKWITDTGDMEALMDLGTGAMLWANLPIVIVLGHLSVRELSQYKRKLKAGLFPRHDAPSITDVVEGHDHDAE